ncbi:hypothetical protein ABEB36_003000 [Hypothenemus hampei]|uniref:Cysteine-rich DPF motif domain-containing protein 1 n=1 Tax=Hypothenemus hampei TaxID=57062 RepID=A0ABD1F7P0_HYPHA
MEESTSTLHENADTKTVKSEVKEEKEDTLTVEAKYFECTLCGLKERYEYFGKEPPFQKSFILLEDCYVIEDPFLPPKQGHSLILGSNCNSCTKPICKDGNCSVYYNGSFCIKCAKISINKFPNAVQEKLNKII